jgi:hypothetical protein
VSKAWSADRELNIARRRDSLWLRPRWALLRLPRAFLLDLAIRLLSLRFPLGKGEGLLSMVLLVRPGAVECIYLPELFVEGIFVPCDRWAEDYLATQ